MPRRVVFLVLIGMCILAGCAGGNGSQVVPAAPAIHHNRVIDAALLLGFRAGDWPFFGYDPGHTGYVDQPANRYDIQGKLLWSRRMGPVFSSAVAGLKMLYIASTDGYLYALKQETGAIAWRVRLDNRLTDATPALKGQVLFVSAHSSALEALNASTGQVYWRVETGEKIQAPPLVVGGRVLVATRLAVWALDTASGRTLWKFHYGAVGWPTTGSPAVSGNILFAGLGTGTRLWALSLSDGHLIWSFDTGDRITSEPLVKANSVYIATWRGRIFALDRVTGKKRWMYSLNSAHTASVVDGVGGSMALAQNRLFVGDYRGVVLCIDAQSGKSIWRFATGAQVLATPVVTNDRIYIGSGDGYFYALNMQTGRPAWRSSTGEIRASASLADGQLFIGSLSGVVYAFR
jgi:outer membrane protein assembly factor BamB